MSSPDLRAEVTETLRRVVDDLPEILSATLTGSFVRSADVADVSDIDFVVVVEKLDRDLFEMLQSRFLDALKPILRKAGYELALNASLGPLKFDAPGRAVLHLMVYTRERHIEHALRSPFTCLDWQRSQVVRRRSLADLFPVVALQPSHFLSSRRSPKDYLTDLSRREISFRRLAFDDDVCREIAGRTPMQPRDEHEFALHILRFLMQNFLKLVTRENREWETSRLAADFATYFPLRMAEHAEFFDELVERKRQRRFDPPINAIAERTAAFVANFEQQFRRRFIDEATTHILFRHAATEANRATGDDAVFLGRADFGLAGMNVDQVAEIVEAVAQCGVRRVFSSGRLRCTQTLGLIDSLTPLPEIEQDSRLREIEYGLCDGLSVAQAREAFPELFAAWARGEDAPFPAGESTRDVLARVDAFTAEAWSGGEATLIATHNVVLRCLFGNLLRIPITDWHRLRIPHARPLRVVQTCWGPFADLDEEDLRAMLGGLAWSPTAGIKGLGQTENHDHHSSVDRSSSGLQSAACR